MKRMSIAVYMATALAGIWGCSTYAIAGKNFELNEQGIKALDKKIAKVELTRQVDGKTQLVEVRINRDPLTGGKNDWNWIAQDGHRLMSTLLEKPEVNRIRLVYISPENKNLDWAYISVNRSDLPSDWNSLSYLQFFGKTKPQAGTLETGQWLCDFYGQYRSARPATGLPKACKG